MKLTKHGGIFLALLLVLVLRALASEAACHPCSKIEFPTFLNLTGSQAASGGQIRAGVEIAVARINAQGGVDGLPLEPNFRDAQSSPEVAVGLVSEQIAKQQKLGAIFVALSTAQVFAMNPKLDVLRVPAVIELARGNAVTTQGNPWIFRLSHKSETEARSFEPYVGRLGIKSASVFYTDADFWRESQMAFQEMLKKKGVEVRSVEAVSTSTTDFVSPLSKIKSAGADTLFVAVPDGRLPEIIRQARAIDPKSRIVVIGVDGRPSAVMKEMGEVVGNTYFTVPPLWVSPQDVTPATGLTKAFLEEWARRKLAPQDAVYGSRGYDGVSTIAEAIRVSKRWDPVGIREALWKVNFVGVSGPIKFEREGPSGRESGQRAPSLYVIEIRDGKERLLP